MYLVIKLKKNIIIDGDKFQKEYKNQYRKELITDLVQGILFIVIAGAGLFFGDKLLLKLFIYIFPLFILPIYNPLPRQFRYKIHNLH